MLLIRLISLGLLSAIPTVCYRTGPEIASHFRRTLSPNTGIYLPSDSNYSSETTQRWNAFGAPSYVVSVKPTRDRDVQKIIRYAAQHNIPFLGTGGGHGYSVSLASIQSGIEIDLSGFNTIKIDKAASTMTVGASLTFKNITGPLAAAGKEFQVGSCSCVGLLGATLGGGLGPYGGLHGLQLDALESVHMITGTGEILDVSATSHSELYWGMRGAGFNFGIVTSAVFKVFDFTNRGVATNAEFVFASNNSLPVWNFMKKYQDSQPSNLAMDIGIGYNPAFGGTYVLIDVVYIGPIEEGRKVVQSLSNAHPLVQNISSVPWKDIETQSKFATDSLACRKGTKHSIYSTNLYKIDVPTLLHLTSYMCGVFDHNPGIRASILAFVQYGRQAVQAVPDENTAYPWRDAIAYSFFDIGFSDASLDPFITQIGTQVRSTLVRTSGSSPAGELQIYVNYAHGDEREESTYGARKLPRLHRLKRKYDPHRLFTRYNGLGYGRYS